jgi:hypothetical protein
MVDLSAGIPDFNMDYAGAIFHSAVYRKHRASAGVALFQQAADRIVACGRPADGTGDSVPRNADIYLGLPDSGVVLPQEVSGWHGVCGRHVSAGDSLHDRILVSTGTGNVLLLGSEEEQITASEKKEPFYVAAGIDGARHGIFKPNPEYGSAIDRWYTRIALMRYRRLLETSPLGFVRLFGVKFLRLWYGTDTATPRPQMALALCSLPIVPLGLWQVWNWRKSHRLLFLVGGGVLLYFIAMHLVLLPMIRYTIPIYPILILATCYWLCQRFSPATYPALATAASPAVR